MMVPASNRMQKLTDLCTTSFSMKISKLRTLTIAFRLLARPKGWTRTGSQRQHQKLRTHPYPSLLKMDGSKGVYPYPSLATASNLILKNMHQNLLLMESGTGVPLRSSRLHFLSMLLNTSILHHLRSIGNHQKASLKSESTQKHSQLMFSMRNMTYFKLHNGLDPIAILRLSLLALSFILIRHI